MIRCSIQKPTIFTYNTQTKFTNTFDITPSVRFNIAAIINLALSDILICA